eukprot:1375877-Amphidinium_carterae.1
MLLIVAPCCVAAAEGAASAALGAIGIALGPCRQSRSKRLFRALCRSFPPGASHVGVRERASEVHGDSDCVAPCCCAYLSA